MKAIFSKKGASFQAGKGKVILAQSKTAETYSTAQRTYEVRSLPLAIYLGNERKHTGIYE